MKWQFIITLPIAALALVASPAFAAPTDKPAVEVTAQRDASIPFADSNVRNWRAQGDSTVYFQDNHDRWYRATLFGPAFDLPFVEAIGIEAGPTGALDQWGAVTVRGQRYPFREFVKVDKPPFETIKAKAKDAAKATS